MRKRMYLSNTETIDDYVTTLYKVVTSVGKRTFLNADIINSKITNIILGIRSKDSTFDTIEFSNSTDTTLTNSLFELFEIYVRMNVYETTGITYTEFKNMSIIEKETLNNYLEFKLETLNLTADMVNEDRPINDNPFDL